MELFGSALVLIADVTAWPAVLRRLRRHGLYPEAVPASGDEGHKMAWARAAVRAEPTLIVSERAVFVPGWRDSLAVAAAAIDDQPWHVVHLDGKEAGAGYVLTAEGAGALLALAANIPDTPASQLLGDADVLAALAVKPPVVVAVPDVGARVVHDLDHLSGVPYDDVVLLVPEHAAVLGDPFELAAALSLSGKDLLGPSWTGATANARVGTAGGLRATDFDPKRPVASDEGAVFARVEADRAPRLIPVHGRLVDVATGDLPLVLLGEPDDVAAVAARQRDLGDRDLARILRYDEAIDPDPSGEVVGPELVSLPFWTPEFCATIVRATEALGAWQSDEVDPVPGREVSLALISPRLFAHVEDHVASIVVPRLRYHWPTLDFHGLRDVFVIKYTAGDVEGLRLHHDVAQVSASVKLNAGYRGGELVFPRQGYGNGALPVGRLLAWPSLVTHPHQVEPVTAGVKFGLTAWFEAPGTKTD